MADLIVKFADLASEPVGAGNDVTAEVLVSYTREVPLTDGTVLQPVPMRKQLGPGGTAIFPVTPADSSNVVTEHQDFGLRVEWWMVYRAKNARQTEARGSRVVKVVTSDGSNVQFGTLPSAEGLPAQWVSVQDFADELGAGVTEAKADAAAADAKATEVSSAVGDAAGGTVTTTTTDRNLNTAIPPAGWRAISAASSFSAGTDYARSTVTAAGSAPADYHGVMTTSRPPISVTGDTPAYLTAEVRSSSAATARIYIQFLQGVTSLGITGTDTDHTVSSEWSTLTIPITVPAAADNYRPTVAAVGPYDAGSTLDVRKVGIITGTGGYFDGDSTDSTGEVEDRAHTWDGTPGASTSTRVVTKRTTTGGLDGRTVVEAINDVEEAVAAIDTGGGGGTMAGPTVTAPPGFALRRVDLPTIHRAGAGFATNIEQVIDDLRPPTAVTYYVSPTGGGDGLTPETSTTLNVARDKSDVGTIIFAPGEYNRSQAGIVGRTSKSINYIAGGPGVVLTGWSQTLAWTHVTGHVYSADRSGARSVGDPRVQHATDGAIALYLEAGTTVEDVTGPGQWATDGTTVWVWALGDTDLSADFTALRVSLGVDVGVMHDGGTAYVEGITVEGADTGSGMNMIGGTLLMRDCNIQGATGNGITAVDALVIAVRTDASTNGMDGFNYHEASGQCDFIEVDCTARRNGWKRTGTNNGSTAHETARGVRVGGRYADSHGPLLADVNDAQTWTLGAVTERTAPDMLPPAPQQGHYHADGAATMWVQDADLSGDGTAWRVSNGASIRVRTPRRVGVASTANLTGAGSTLERF